MATKAQVKKLATKQGAECNIGYNSDGDVFIEVALPDGFIWDNGYGSGVLYQEKYEDETMSEFWSNAYDYIDAKVIKAN